MWRIWRQGWSDQPLSLFLLGKRTGLLLLVKPEEKEVVGWVWPRDWPLTTVGNYGRLPLVGVGRLAREEKTAALFPTSLMANLGVPVQLAIFQDRDTCLKKQQWQHCAMSWLWYQGVLGHADVVFGRRIDFLKLFLFLHRYHLTWRIKPVYRQNGGEGQTNWQTKQWHEQNWHLFLVPDIRQQGVSLAIYNAGARPGMAKEISQVFKAAGARVVQIGDKQEQRRCRWLVSRQVDKRVVLRYFYRILHCPISFSKRTFFNDTSQLQLWLGKDWFRYLGKR